MWEIQANAANGYTMLCGYRLVPGRWETLEIHADYHAASEAVRNYYGGTGLFRVRIRFVRT